MQCHFLRDDYLILSCGRVHAFAIGVVTARRVGSGELISAKGEWITCHKHVLIQNLREGVCILI
jgi:hypothetical protein